MTLYILLTTPTTDAGPFNMYSNTDGYTSAFATNVSETTLLSGYTAYNVPDETTIVRLVSVGEKCNNYLDFQVGGGPVTSTSTTSSTSTSTSSTTSTTSSTSTTTSSSTSTTTTTTTTINDVKIYLDANNPASYPGSGTLWTDLSPNGNNGLLMYGVGYSSLLGGQLIFDGSDDRITVSNSASLNPTTAITISLVLSSNNSNPSIFRSPLMKATDSNWLDGYGFYENASEFHFYINQYNGAQKVSTPKLGFSLRNFVGVYDKTNLKLYENGVLVASGTPYTLDIVNSSTHMNIGAGAGDIYNYGGSISQVVIYNRALSAAEILSNYNYLKTIYAI